MKSSTENHSTQMENKKESIDTKPEKQQMDLKSLITNAHDRDTNSMEQLLKQFSPLLEKYTRYLHYDGADTDLKISFIEVIYSVNCSMLSVYDDGQIVTFIQRAIKRRAIDLYRRNSKYQRETFLPENFEQEDPYPYYASIYFNDMLQHLTKKQQRILRYKFQHQLSDSEIGTLLHISRQSVYRCLRRALDQLRKEVKK